MKYFFIILFLSLRSYSISISPMTAQYETVGIQTSQVYTLSNENKESTVVEVIIQTRSTNIDGTEVNHSSDEISKAFSIFPQSTVIAPNQTKGIRVTYVGPKNLDKEVNYRIIFYEKPVKRLVDPNQKKTFKILSEFITSAFISPKGGSPNLKLESFTSDKDKLMIKFSNNGIRHQLAPRINLKITDTQGKTVVISEKDEKSLANNFLAGESRVIPVKKPSSLKGEATKITLESFE